MGENSGSGDRSSEATTEVGQEPPTSLGSGECCYSAGEVLKELSGRGHAQCEPCLVGVIACGSHVPWELRLVKVMSHRAHIPIKPCSKVGILCGSQAEVVFPMSLARLRVRPPRTLACVPLVPASCSQSC